MPTPREHLIDPEAPFFDHLVSRGVQRAFARERERVTGRDYSRRIQWLIDRLHLLVQRIAVDLYGYSFMSN